MSAQPVQPASPPTPSTPTGLSDTLAKVERIGADRRLAGAERIVGTGAGPRTVAARRFLEAADKLGMDLSNMWGVFDANGRHARQVCLAVVGTGRTAMLFVSGPDPDAPVDDPELAVRERQATISAACRHLASLREPETGEQGVVLVQALLEQEEVEALRALLDSGFMRLGDLAYLRRPIPRSGGGVGAASMKLPEGVALRRMVDTPAEMASLTRALEGSYEQTMDCPELCGLRDVGDVLESHRSVGVFDPGMWYLVTLAGVPEGCMLLNGCPEQNTVELVYLGLSPALRGKGLGAMLLTMGIQSLTGRPEKHLTCAVDTRNVPAMALYRRCGFQRFASRVPLVLSLRSSESA